MDLLYLSVTSWWSSYGDLFSADVASDPLTPLFGLGLL